jgi:hypothetical protein
MPTASHTQQYGIFHRKAKAVITLARLQIPPDLKKEGHTIGQLLGQL